MLRKSLWAAALAVCFSGQLSFAAGSLDEALTEIAGQIVESLPQDDLPTVAISTFTHTGNTCSDLSNYISEIMLPTVQRNGNFRIFARSQLSAIFRELELVYDGTISPSAAQEIGKISGVEAILTGNITPFGQRLMVIATLIDTSDGGVLASATADFPITETERALLATQNAALCGFINRSGGSGPATTSASSTTTGGLPLAPSGDTSFSSDIFEAQVASLYYAPTSGDTTWTIRFRNISDKPIGLSAVPGSFSIADGIGGVMAMGEQWSGVRQCYRATQLQYCNTSDPKYATILPPGKVAQLNFNSSGAKDLANPLLTVSMEFVVTPDTSDTATYDVRSVGFFDLQPVIR
ncbi:FlgO family outer membrane protein [Actibacterium sp. 188UL27-1]|uniref:FlgO family outer membrane protein n=1 Tax=Actibacterium sp. 188UL27-1 TaxID=2786961 RepID=UPI00195C37C4|nr:FlgO family outer membrane protein [Actibacterium sp. 188UL27-1]MBM7066159.1 hypothetical protein [Actibacterium sp. 188UL27-1]